VKIGTVLQRLQYVGRCLVGTAQRGEQLVLDRAAAVEGAVFHSSEQYFKRV
jgi:hypothetical protein